MTQSVTAKYGRSIALLFIAIFIKEVIWFCLIPPFQVGDEASHYDYVVYQAKQKIPGKPIDLRFVDTSGFDYSKKEGFGYTSGEVNYLNTALRSEFVHEYRKRRYPRSVIFPFILSQDLAAPHIQDLALYKKENVLNTASQYPPLYYAISAFFYRFAAAIDKNNILLPFYFVRFSSIIYFILSLFLFNKIMARLKIGRKLAFSIMALIGFQPELSMTTVSVNPDNLVMLLTALITYCAVDIFNSKFVNKTPAFIALGFLSGLLWLTKTHFFIAVFSGVLFSFILYFILEKKKEILVGSAISFWTAIATGCWFSLWSIMVYGNPFGYTKAIGELYISVGPTLERFFVWLGYMFTVGFKSFWGNWGWLEFSFPDETFLVLAILWGISLCGIIVYAAKNVKRLFDKNTLIDKLAYFAVILPVLIFSLFMVYFNSCSIRAVVCQGRIWFPFILSIIWLFLFGFWGITKKEKIRNAIITIVVGYILILDIYATIIIYKRYYYLPKNKPNIVNVLTLSDEDILN